jgi:hypothetical protein
LPTNPEGRWGEKKFNAPVYIWQKAKKLYLRTSVFFIAFLGVSPRGELKHTITNILTKTRSVLFSKTIENIFCPKFCVCSHQNHFLQFFFAFSGVSWHKELKITKKMALFSEIFSKKCMHVLFFKAPPDQPGPVGAGGN